jgi:3-hydroxyisobutyrate dehydrogenase-like beta-hydroxyacid dehydrogenase
MANDSVAGRMSSQIVGLIHPGEMGAAVGGCAVSRGARVLWVAAGRSSDSAQRAKTAGLTSAESLEALVRTSDTILSVCPPHAAVDVAKSVAQIGFRGVYLDANAIAPDTTREVGRIVTAAGARFVDGGIIGPPPSIPGRTRLYLSGDESAHIAQLFEGTLCDTILLGPVIGAASAVKACYAAWTKGTQALLADVHALAEHEGVSEALYAEWRKSQPALEKTNEQMANNTRKAWRWIGEMEELALGFRNAGLPDGFHLASAEIYRRLADFKGGTTPPAISAIAAAVRKNKS